MGFLFWRKTNLSFYLRKAELRMYFKSSDTKRLRFRELEITDINDWEAFFVNNPSLDYLGFDINHDKHTLAKEWIGKRIASANVSIIGPFLGSKVISKPINEGNVKISAKRIAASTPIISIG